MVKLVSRARTGTKTNESGALVETYEDRDVGTFPDEIAAQAEVDRRIAQLVADKIRPGEWPLHRIVPGVG
jgi:hypothetical protein